MNNFSWSLSYTWITIIDGLFYASDSWSWHVSWEYIAKLLVALLYLLQLAHVNIIFCLCWMILYVPVKKFSVMSGHYTAGNSLMSLITSHFVGWRASLCGLQHSILRRDCWSKLALGNNPIQNLRLGRYIIGYTFGNHVLRRDAFSTTLRCRAKFPTVYLAMYLPKLEFWIHLFPNAPTNVNALANLWLTCKNFYVKQVLKCIRKGPFGRYIPSDIWLEITFYDSAHLSQ